MSKTITYLMPGPASIAMGGYKIVFEYANRLTADGYCVNIVLPCSLIAGKPTLKKIIAKWCRYFYYLLVKNPRPYSWFNLDRRIKLVLTPSLSQFYIPKADIYIATGVHTSIYLNKYKTVAEKKYFVQGYETWGIDADTLHQTYRYDMSKITISPYLYEIIKRECANVVLIENGFDFDYFKLTIPIKEKDKYRVVMLYHTQKLKGIDDGIRALEIVREKYPQVRANFFGLHPKSSNLPEWIDYYQQPNQNIHNKIYNEASIFVGPSHSEGFCLTPPEAMMCGCAVVCTDIGGYTVICKDGLNALISDIADTQTMANNIIKLIEDDNLRYRIAENGYMKIQEYTWERAYNKFKNEIEKNNGSDQNSRSCSMV